MPISIQLSPNLLTNQGQRTVFSRIAAILLEVHGLEGNKFMTPNVVGHVTVLPEGSSFVDGTPQSLAVIEVKVPATTFPNADVRQAFIARVTDVIDELKAGQHPRDRTYVNVTYAVDGAWGLAAKRTRTLSWALPSQRVEVPSELGGASGSDALGPLAPHFGK